MRLKASIGFLNLLELQEVMRWRCIFKAALNTGHAGADLVNIPFGSIFVHMTWFMSGIRMFFYRRVNHLPILAKSIRSLVHLWGGCGV